MQVLTSEQQIKKCFDEYEIVIVYFSGSTCGACQIIRKRLEQILHCYPDVKGVQIDAVQYPHIAAQYSVFSLPLFILFVKGKEIVRESKHVDLLEFEQRILRYRAILKE